jgi:hypothetical protein
MGHCKIVSYSERLRLPLTAHVLGFGFARERSPMVDCCSVCVCLLLMKRHFLQDKVQLPVYDS